MSDGRPGGPAPQPGPAYPTMHRLAAARAVLAPLCGASDVAFPPRAATVGAVQALWRARVRRLRAAGFGPLSTALKAAWADNCPPLAFARDESGHRPCNLPRLCPF